MRYYWQEEDLSTDDNLNGTVGSFVVMSGLWKFYAKPAFSSPYQAEFSPGAYGSAEEQDINILLSAVRLR